MRGEGWGVGVRGGLVRFVRGGLVRFVRACSRIHGRVWVSEVGCGWPFHPPILQGIDNFDED